MISIRNGWPDRDARASGARVALAVVCSAVGAPLLLVFWSVPLGLVSGDRINLSHLLVTLPGYLFFAVLITGPITLVLALPLYLFLKHVGWARPAVALCVGAAMGSALIMTLSEARLHGSIVGALAGGCTGLLFLRIAGWSLPPRSVLD